MHSRIVVVVFALAVAISSCGDPAAIDTTEPESAYAAQWQQLADDFRAFQNAQRVPDHLWKGEGLDGTEFDPQAFFEVLDRIDVEPGFVLDFVYAGSPAYSGYPVLYTRRADAPRFLTLDDWAASPQSDAGYMEQIYVVDGTPEGFFQYVVLDQIGEQFYLFWHAQDRDLRIVATRQRLETLIDAYADQMEPRQVTAARSVDPTPRVVLGIDAVTVDVVTFTPWGGFSRNVYTIEKVFPQRILEVARTSVGECDCGPTF